MPKFDLKLPYQPSGDQPQAIKKLVDGMLYGFFVGVALLFISYYGALYENEAVPPGYGLFTVILLLPGYTLHVLHLDSLMTLACRNQPWPPDCIQGFLSIFNLLFWPFFAMLIGALIGALTLHKRNG